MEQEHSATGGVPGTMGGALALLTALVNATIEPLTPDCNASTSTLTLDDPACTSNLTAPLQENVTNQSANDWQYCSTEGWNDFRQSYQAVHGCLSLVVCVFGSIANVINMVVLTRKSMVSPTNAILTGLAVTDLLVMAEYIPYTMHQYVWSGRPLTSRYAWGWTVFVLFHAHFTQVFHTLSICLTVMLAVWRYIAIANPQNNATWCSMQRTFIVIVAAFFASVVCNVPNYLNITIFEKEHDGHTLYVIGFSSMALANGGVLKNINFWIYAVIFKLLPCTALTVLSLALIKELLRAAQRRAKLMNSSGSAAKAERQADRVTKMLLAILVLFLASEFPQGILGFLTAIPDSGFLPCYLNLGEIMDMLVLFNSAINFLLYCVMSQQFRDTFSELFKPFCVTFKTVRTQRFLPRWKAVRGTDPGTESNNTCITHV